MFGRTPVTSQPGRAPGCASLGLAGLRRTGRGSVIAAVKAGLCMSILSPATGITEWPGTCHGYRVHFQLRTPREFRAWQLYLSTTKLTFYV